MVLKARRNGRKSQGQEQGAWDARKIYRPRDWGRGCQGCYRLEAWGRGSQGLLKSGRTGQGCLGVLQVGAWGRGSQASYN